MPVWSPVRSRSGLLLICCAGSTTRAEGHTSLQTSALSRAHLLPPCNSIYASQMNWSMTAFFCLVGALVLRILRKVTAEKFYSEFYAEKIYLFKAICDHSVLGWAWRSCHLPNVAQSCLCW